MNKPIKGSNTSNNTVIKLNKSNKFDSSTLDLSFAILKKGAFVFILENSEGKEFPLKIIDKENYVFGGYSYFLKDFFESSFSFIALEDCEIELFSPKESEELLTNNEFLIEYLQNFITNISSFLDESTWRLNKDLEKFLAYFIIRYSKDNQLEIRNSSLVIKYFNCGKSNFYNTINSLIEKKLIKKSGKLITILDIENLTKLSLEIL